MADLAALEAQALELEPEARAKLVDILLESLDLQESKAATQAWFDEVRRRRQQVANGSIALLDGDELLKDLDGAE